MARPIFVFRQFALKLIPAVATWARLSTISPSFMQPKMYRDQGKYEEAEALFKRALTIREQTLGTGHPAVARTFNNMAILYKARGEIGSALPAKIAHSRAHRR
jgi:hypothetical protein